MKGRRDPIWRFGLICMCALAAIVLGVPQQSNAAHVNLNFGIGVPLPGIVVGPPVVLGPVPMVAAPPPRVVVEGAPVVVPPPYRPYYHRPHPYYRPYPHYYYRYRHHPGYYYY